MCFLTGFWHLHDFHAGISGHQLRCVPWYLLHECRTWRRPGRDRVHLEEEVQTPASVRLGSTRIETHHYYQRTHSLGRRSPWLARLRGDSFESEAFRTFSHLSYSFFSSYIVCC